jgi:transcriptional regulator with XRE-family HTH domain
MCTIHIVNGQQLFVNGRQKMSLVIGSQLKAARALVGVEQIELADAAGVHPNTIRAMEARGRSEITGSVSVLRRVQRAMEEFGVIFTNGTTPGVRLAEPIESSAGEKPAVAPRAVKKPRGDVEGIAAAC